MDTTTGESAAVRLSDADRREAIAAFVEHQYPEGDEPDGYLDGCTVLYGDDHDRREARYQVVDSQGRGDGSGEWSPVDHD